MATRMGYGYAELVNGQHAFGELVLFLSMQIDQMATKCHGHDKSV